MTAKQKKNLRKKLYRKRKKLEQSQNNSKLDLTNESIDTSEQRSLDNNDEKEGEDNEEPNLDTINIDDVAIGGDAKKDSTKNTEKPKAKVVSNSTERNGDDQADADEDKLNGLLENDNADQDKKQTEDGQGQSAPSPEELKRGPRIGDDV